MDLAFIFLAGVVVGTIIVSFGLCEYFKRQMNNRYVRYLDAKAEYHFGQHHAFGYCRDLLLKAVNVDDAQEWVFRLMGEAEEKAQGIVTNRMEDAQELAMEDTRAQLEERREL